MLDFRNVQSFTSRMCVRSVLLTWAVPLNDNHDPILSYKIYVRENSEEEAEEIDTGLNETKFLVTGLHPFTTYSFRVAARNNIGCSEPSKESFHTQTHRERKPSSKFYNTVSRECVQVPVELPASSRVRYPS